VFRVDETIERGFVKICGVTNVHDAKAVVHAGANALGLIFAESPRRVTREQARDILEATDGDIFRSAVFRENDDESIRAHLHDLDVEMVQIHGALSDALLESIRQRPRLLVKALSIDDREFSTFDESRVDAILIDGPRPGSGTTHSWDCLRERVFQVPVIVAGGLNPDNVADTILATRAWGVDCASGVESSARSKDRRRVSSFVTNARQAFALLKE
jgi:phosphoribosylanthranilate isomerase